MLRTQHKTVLHFDLMEVRSVDTIETLDNATSSENMEMPLRRLSYSSEGYSKLTHYTFKYPAKFHPPVARALIERFSQPGDVLYDPFCGSGTLMVEAAVLGRHSIGSDIDPLAVFVSRAKTTVYDIDTLKKTTERVASRLAAFRRADADYEGLQQDHSLEAYDAEVAERNLEVPAIPKLFHWFRRYVVADLATIKQVIANTRMAKEHRRFLMLCFASIIRSASNADPVPVSGLEVTSHMKKKDGAGRTINPYALLDRAIKRSLRAVEEFAQQLHNPITTRVFRADATRASYQVKRPVDCIITSPPYHNAVDYYRRHTLEMYWLNFTMTQEERLALRPKYIGRDQVAAKYCAGHLKTPLAKEWDKRIRAVSSARADTFKHYMLSMTKTFSQMARILPSGGDAVFVVGKSTWNGYQLPTVNLFEDLSSTQFRVKDVLWYPITNRYMSYSRRNGANIDKEFVIVMEKKANA